MIADFQSPAPGALTCMKGGCPMLESEPHEAWENTLFALIVIKALYQGKKRVRGESNQPCDLQRLCDIVARSEVKKVEWWESIATALESEAKHVKTASALHQYFSKKIVVAVRTKNITNGTVRQSVKLLGWK
jgi:hypothetical protein